jgi:hypothetical protein
VGVCVYINVYLCVCVNRSVVCVVNVVAENVYICVCMCE